MRIAVKCTIITIIGLTLATGVFSRSRLPKPFPLGDYRYSQFDKAGTKIAEGTVSITSRKSDHISGEWRIKRIGNVEHPGSHILKGRFEGEMEDDKATIDLNPDLRDANLILSGKFDGSRFHGEWSFSSIKGVVDSGTFEAIKKQSKVKSKRG